MHKTEEERQSTRLYDDPEKKCISTKLDALPSGFWVQTTSVSSGRSQFPCSCQLVGRTTESSGNCLSLLIAVPLTALNRKKNLGHVTLFHQNIISYKQHLNAVFFTSLLDGRNRYVGATFLDELLHRDLYC